MAERGRKEGNPPTLAGSTYRNPFGLRCDVPHRSVQVQLLQRLADFFGPRSPGPVPMAEGAAKRRPDDRIIGPGSGGLKAGILPPTGSPAACGSAGSIAIAGGRGSRPAPPGC